jgi:DNA-directed RNA polymerase subunit RPC12/RpoP
MTTEAIIFCERCGKQFSTIDEIAECICDDCKSNNEIKGDHFSCWACGKRLDILSEVAQGICHNCKLSIIKKLNPLTTKEIVNSIISRACISIKGL